jgi:asparagine synthase (glutamine-hydrolysing)
MDLAVLQAMLAAIRHRGPDDEGVWHADGAWLGQRRLSIVDLSAAGHQPMTSSDGRYVITLNGEIYNHASLRRCVDVAGEIAWRGHSDTEVLIEAIARFGLDRTLCLCQGMFAFALWDRREREAHLVRDRMGEKPLCYFANGAGLSFASDMSALRKAPDVPTVLSAEALSLYFRFGYIPSPHAIVEGVRKLPPGSVLTWRAGAPPVVRAFWSLGEVIREGRSDPRAKEAGAIDALDGLLRDVIGEQMLADVPLGAFLSGGIDSSLVTAIMQSLSDRPVKTFTLGFDSADFNEADDARAVARHLGTDHTEHCVTQADAQAIVPRLGAIFDEPFADASQVPTFLVSRMARQHVTVCLTGDGGDEVFGGYVRYPGAPRLWDAVRRWPLRSIAASALRGLPLGVTEAALGFLGPLAGRYTSRGRLGPSLRRAADWIEAASFEELYELTMTAWADPDSVLVDPPASVRSWRPSPPWFSSRLEAMMWRDSIDYLPGDILCKLDRATMANSLESRAPLLDSRIVEFAWRAPESMKLNGGVTKWMLRQVLYRYVPQDLVERPKRGFSVPQHAWLTGALKGWADQLLDPDTLRRQGMLRPEIVSRLWKRYQGGDSSLNHKVWTILMFQSWAEANGL